MQDHSLSCPPFPSPFPLHAASSAGQNLDSAASSDGKPALDGKAVLEHWINGKDEAGSYNPDNPTASHFTQVVWKSTTHVGCAVVECNLSLYNPSWWPAKYVVCNYSPAGNVEGEYKDNVGSLKS